MHRERVYVDHLPRALAGGDAGPAASRYHAAAAEHALPAAAAITRWAFYLYVAWIPLEYPSRALPFDLGTLVGAIFLATTVLSVRACYARVPAPVVWYGCFVYIWVIAFVANGGHYAPLVRDSFLRLLLLVLVFWAAANLLRDLRIARISLVILIVACATVAFLQVTGLADMYPGTTDEGNRETVLGQNPNRTGRFLATAAIAAVGLTLSTPGLGTRLRPVAMAVVGLLLVAMVQGGSRGAMLTLVAGMLPFALVAQSFGVRIRNTIIASLVVAGLAWTALQSPVMRQRMALAESGNLAKREVIFPIAFQMAKERPLLGWGPINAYYEVGTRLAQPGHERRDTHNLVLELLTTTGVLGAIPALVALALCVGAAWSARHGPLGALPIALMLALLAGNMSGNFLSFKIYWYAQALAIAAPFAAGPFSRRAR